MTALQERGVELLGHQVGAIEAEAVGRRQDLRGAAARCRLDSR